MKNLMCHTIKISLNDIKLAAMAWFVYLITCTLITRGFYAFFKSWAGEPVSQDGNYIFWLSTLFSDLQGNYPGVMTSVIIVTILLFFILFLLSLFLSGGIYASLRGNASVTARGLISASARHFSQMVKSFLVNILTFVAAAIVPGVLFYLHYRSQTSTLNEALLEFFVAGWGLLAMIFFICAMAVYDMTRVNIIKHGTSAFASLKTGIKIFYDYKGTMFLLFFLYLLLASVLMLAYAGISMLHPPVIFTLMIMQSAIFLRYLLKILLMKAETFLVN